MSTVVLNGGNFGGTEIEWPEGAQEITMLDSGEVSQDPTAPGWRYSATLNAGTATAEFVGMRGAA